MTLQDFEKLGEQDKVQMIFDANKITEKIDDEANYQLFQIGKFYVETKTSLEGKFKRNFKTFTLKDLPVDYAGEVLGMPIVKFEKDLNPVEVQPIVVKTKEKTT